MHLHWKLAAESSCGCSWWWCWVCIDLLCTSLEIVSRNLLCVCVCHVLC